MQLEVRRTNNHPGVVANYFIDCVQNVGGTACVIHGDMGAENEDCCCAMLSMT